MAEKEISMIARVQQQRASPNMKWLRFSLAVTAVIIASANVFASASAESPQVAFWLLFETSAYITIAIVYLLGLKSWYLFATLFSIFNISIFVISSFVIIPFISPQLTGNLSFSSYNYGQAFALFGWIYIISVGFFAYKIDRGSKLDKILNENIV
ncbi:MAG: hypothetical protein M1331_02905 [Candidatus Marsarchaeota archaeon]|nr:hypothetical protein [Candidatus Marsarchaeota archaeon]MCL5106316.1 hypothetical protein [Candidatus Marsarchaeota archaeon]